MPHPWTHSRSGCMREALSTWWSCRCPCSLQGDWARWLLKLPSNSNNSMFLWFYDPPKKQVWSLIKEGRDSPCLLVSTSHWLSKRTGGDHRGFRVEGRAGIAPPSRQRCWRWPTAQHSHNTCVSGLEMQILHKGEDFVPLTAAVAFRMVHRAME